jgi:myo-inositol-1(or 4)-monophosphatase
MKKLIDLIIQAGVLALKEQKKLIVSNKVDTSIVTNGDLAVSKLLEVELKKLYPDHDIFSEENSKNLPKSDKVIIIDPIDGTESYSRSQDSWSILVGFLDKMVPVGGIVYQPTNGRLYTGFKGQGSFLTHQGVTTRLNAQGEAELKAVLSPKNYDEDFFLNQLKIRKRTELYSAALKIMEVAKGAADVYPNFRGKCSLWDLVAPVVILEEAGGQIIYEKNMDASFEKPEIAMRFCAIGKRIKKSDIDLK